MARQLPDRFASWRKVVKTSTPVRHRAGGAARRSAKWRSGRLILDGVERIRGPANRARNERGAALPGTRFREGCPVVGIKAMQCRMHRDAQWLTDIRGCANREHGWRRIPPTAGFPAGCNHPALLQPNRDRALGRQLHAHERSRHAQRQTLPMSVNARSRGSPPKNQLCEIPAVHSLLPLVELQKAGRKGGIAVSLQ